MISPRRSPFGPPSEVVLLESTKLVYIISFPKTRRYTLGQRLDDSTLDIFELLFSIPNAKSKVETLMQISTKLDLIKVLLRLAKDNQAIKSNRYLELQATLQEIGKMLGGWIKVVR